MYYDIDNRIPVSDAEMARRGLAALPPKDLHKFGFYELQIEIPKYDKETHGVEPDGKPAPDQDNPLVFIQHMKIYNLLERQKETKKYAATSLRWAHETGGVTLPDGTSVLTGIDDQNRISTAIQGMRDTGMAEVDFKAASGWIRLTLEQLQGIAGVIATHVQACFSNERALHEKIDAAKNMDELNAINLEEGWPEYSSSQADDAGQGEQAA